MLLIIQLLLVSPKVARVIFLRSLCGSELDRSRLSSTFWDQMDDLAQELVALDSCQAAMLTFVYSISKSCSWPGFHTSSSEDTTGLGWAAWAWA